MENIVAISIVIATFNRKEVLRTLLERLAHQTLAPERFEVLLCDDGSSDGLLDMVATLTPPPPYALHVLPGEHSGPGAAHNRGIRAARAKLVLLLAADILPVPCLVAEHLASHHAYPAAQVVVGGGLTQSGELQDTPLQRAVNRLNEPVFTDDFRSVRHGGFLVSNLSLKRAFLLQHGLFHEWPPASGEDLEMGYRLRRHGMELVRNPRALGYHHHEETLASLMQRSYLTGYNVHHLVETVDELWVRRRFGDAGSSTWRTHLRDLLRVAVLNRLSAAWLLQPMIALAERRRALEPLLPYLCLLLGAYYFDRGIADFRAGLSFDPGRAGTRSLDAGVVVKEQESA